MSSGYSILFALFGVVAIALFHADIYFPIWLSVAILVFVSLYLLQQYRKKRLGILMLLIWLVYALPFIHIPPYIFFEFSRDPLLLWGLAVNPYMVDEQVITLTAMIGAVGGMGIAFGASLNSRRIQPDLSINLDGSKRLFPTITMPVWLVWVVIGVALTALSAPQETILTAAYTESKTSLDGANFSSAWMMSYVILSFAFCDALLERQGTVKHLKMIIILAAIILVVVYFQLLRGDRESVPWVFGLALVYYYWAAGITQRRGFTIPWLKISGVAFGLVAISMVLGAIRSGLTGASLADAGALIGDLYESESIGLANVLHGTWSAVLLTPLSVAGDHIDGLLAVKWGQDYLNLFLSIIPGFLADSIGYIRPIDSGQSPAWEMRYGLGGTHATVVPFMNFRMLGVFLGPAIWTFIMIKYEKMALRQVSVIKLSLLVTIAMASPHWLWYGEKNGFNALVLWLILAFFYRVSLSMFRSSARSVGLPANHGGLDVKP
jgi:hypothetical protein